MENTTNNTNKNMYRFLKTTYGFDAQLLQENELEQVKKLYDKQQWISLSKIFSGYAIHEDKTVILNRLNKLKNTLTGVEYRKIITN